MRFSLTPDAPRPLSRVYAGVAPGRDARWLCAGTTPGNQIFRRDDGRLVQTVDRTRVHDRQVQLAVAVTA